jgi:hypothetical protein
LAGAWLKATRRLSPCTEDGTLIYFDDPEWVDYITFEAKGGQPHSAAEVEAEGKRRE